MEIVNVLEKASEEEDTFLRVTGMHAFPKTFLKYAKRIFLEVYLTTLSYLYYRCY